MPSPLAPLADPRAEMTVVQGRDIPAGIVQAGRDWARREDASLFTLIRTFRNAVLAKSGAGYAREPQEARR
jgi:hypothetical protein